VGAGFVADGLGVLLGRGEGMPVASDGVTAAVVPCVVAGVAQAVTHRVKNINREKDAFRCNTAYGLMILKVLAMLLKEELYCSH
jgi:hypothetical protein